MAFGHLGGHLLCTMDFCKDRDCFICNTVNQSKRPDWILANFFSAKFRYHMPGSRVLSQITRGLHKPDNNPGRVLW